MKLDVLEVALIVTFCCVVTAWGVGRFARAESHVAPDLEWLAATYGPEKQSQFIEEWVIRDFFQDRRDGIFVDVGAADYRHLSNTYFLEHSLGWSGIAVEPQLVFEPAYRQFRPRTKFRPFFVSDKSDERAVLYVNEVPWVASSDRDFTSRWGTPKAATVPTITLNDLLEAEKVERVDFLSMDIELAEPRALAGFDVKRFKPQLVCIEAHPEVRQKILDYFTANDYTIIGKYLRMDDWNLYFMPLGQAVRPLPESVMENWVH